MPRYWVWCPELGEDESQGLDFDASDVMHAAIRWAKRHDRESTQYAIAKGADLRVMVRDLENRALYAFRVFGEMVPTYSVVDIFWD